MKKKVISIILAGLTAITLAACGPATSDEKTQSAQEKLLQAATDELGLPNIFNLTEKAQMKQIMELCDKSDLVCYVYTFSEYTGKYNYAGKCIGFGLPYGTEYTNPEKSEYYSNGGRATLPQADPNGLFKAQGVQATWICMIDPVNGARRLQFAEPNMTINNYPMPKDMLNSVPANYDSVLDEFYKNEGKK